MHQKNDSVRRFNLSEWICGCAILAAVSAFLFPVLASAKESVRNVTLSSAKAKSMAASLYSEAYDMASAQTDCLQEGDFVTADGGCMDTLTGTVWSGSYGETTGAPSGYPNFSEATNYCNMLADGGFEDWRLPAASTLQLATTHDIVDYVESYNNNSGASHEFTSTTRKGGKEVLAVRFNDGNSAWILIKGPGNPPRYSRLDHHCVRGPG